MTEDETDLSDVVAPLFLLVVGAAIAGGGLYLYQDATQASSNAVEVDATVVSSAVESKMQDGDQGGSQHRVYYAEIQYRYTYEGESYTSTNLCPGAGSSCDAAQNKDERSEAQDIVDRYPENETATAHVPPSEPSNAFLVDAKSSSTNEYFILVGIGGLLALLGLVGFVNVARSLVSG